MSEPAGKSGENRKPSNFIRAIIDADLESGKHASIRTRFPPEPNGYLHIGHAKSICLNFGLAHDYQGTCHLRFDDTNPSKEDVEYVESIQRDIQWLGFDWGENLYFASDYFQRMYDLAVDLIKQGKAYVCSLSPEDMKKYRGTLTQPGKESPFRKRTPEENLALFDEMRRGLHEEGSHVLRAVGDMSSPNIKMRDPSLYRIMKAPHHRTGDTWKIYPMYDYAHPLEDALEDITHSICTLEFENNREIYNWVVAHTAVPSNPRQYEFARLNLNYTVMSKRKLKLLVDGKHVSGWDDPRMPTLAGMRRRGYTAEAIRDFCDRIGVAKANSTVDIGMLEFCVRDDLNHQAPRVMAVLDPLKLVIENYPADQVEQLDAPSFPHDVPKEGSRLVPFRRELYIERDDFMEDPPKKYFRLAPGGEVRLRYGYVVKCVGVVKDEAGKISEVRCVYDPDTLGKKPSDRKVAGTIHWVPAVEALPAAVRLYDRLFHSENPGGDDFLDHLNPNSLRQIKGLVEPSLGEHEPGRHYQFERLGYFYSDPIDSQKGTPVFNRTVGLRDSWAKATAEKPAATPKAKKEAPPAKREIPPEIAARMGEIAKQYGLSSGDAETLAGNGLAMDFFQKVLNTHNNPRLAAAWVNTELMRALKDKTLEELPFGPVELGELLALIDGGTISGSIAKDVFAEMVISGGRPGQIVEEKGLRQVSNTDQLEAILDGVLSAHPDEVTRYRAGEQKLVGFFMGQVMKASKGKANPKLVKDLLADKLG